MKIFQTFCLLLVFLTANMPASGNAKNKFQENNNYLFSAQDINKVRQLVKANNPEFLPAANKVKDEANAALQQGPWTVVDKKQTPPSGNKHDYMSIGKYWWPDPQNPNGPYIRKDGLTNPNTVTSDKEDMGDMADAVETLALAYYLFGKGKYAQRAVFFLRVWFLNKDTYMSPNMNYGQAIPGRNSGRQYGIIETRKLIRIIDAIQLLKSSQFLTPSDQAGLKNWFAKYLQWLLNSDFGTKESRNGNNHETSYTLQVISFSLFVGKPDIAEKQIEKHFKQRIIRMIEPDGRQPRELARTKALHYSMMNLSMIIEIAEIARKMGIKLYSYETQDGRSIRKALDFLYPFVSGQRKWPYQQIVKSAPDYDDIFYILRIAGLRYNCPDYERTLQNIYKSGYKNHRGQLYWPRFD